DIPKGTAYFGSLSQVCSTGTASDGKVSANENRAPEDVASGIHTDIRHDCEASDHQLLQ
ncbi:hypothetical protein ACJMK2_043834, partial [Sinanodonta woodiana]